jgi:hypothetical protein
VRDQFVLFSGITCYTDLAFSSFSSACPSKFRDSYLKLAKTLSLLPNSYLLTINPLKPKLVEIIFKNSVRTAMKTPHFTITEINWLTLFKEIIAVYSENHAKPINTKCRVSEC